jgi:hypothetical protein
MGYGGGVYNKDGGANFTGGNGAGQGNPAQGFQPGDRTTGASPIHYDGLPWGDLQPGTNGGQVLQGVGGTWPQGPGNPYGQGVVPGVPSGAAPPPPPAPLIGGVPNPGNYQYSSNYGNANQTEGAYAGMGAAAQGHAAPTVADPQGRVDQSRAGGVMNGFSNVNNYYQGVLNGTAPSMAQAQMTASTDQAIRAQEAMANSARGPLAGALAGREAAQSGNVALQDAAQKSMIGRIQEEQNAAQGYGQNLANEGGFSATEQGLNQNLGIEQARTQEQQNALNQAGALGYAQLGQQTSLAQLGAGNDLTKAQLAEQGLQQQGSQFQTGQNNNLLAGAIGAGAALLPLLAADVKMRDPAGGSGFTLREEPDFIAVRNDRTGKLGKLRVDPLEPHEMQQARAPHGADALTGPIAHPLPIRDPRTGNLFAADLPLAGVEDSPQLSAAMQGAVGAPNAYGAYTPDAGAPGGLGSVLAGSDMNAAIRGLDPKTRKALLGASSSMLQGAARTIGSNQAPPVPSMASLLGG